VLPSFFFFPPPSYILAIIREAFLLPSSINNGLEKQRVDSSPPSLLLLLRSLRCVALTKECEFSFSFGAFGNKRNSFPPFSPPFEIFLVSFSREPPPFLPPFLAGVCCGRNDRAPSPPPSFVSFEQSSGSALLLPFFSSLYRRPRGNYSLPSPQRPPIARSLVRTSLSFFPSFLIFFSPSLN